MNRNTCNYGFIYLQILVLKCWSDENFHHWSRHMHCQQIALWVISLVLAMQHTYIQSMLNLARFISCITHISSIIDINRFALLTLIMGGQDSNLNFKLLDLLSSYWILKRSHHFCDNINIFQWIEGVLLKTVLPICIY
jgi:hypothetical protein